MPVVFKLIAIVLIAAMACLLIIPVLGTWQAATKQRDLDWSAPSLIALAALLTAAALFGGITGFFNRGMAAAAIALNLLWLAVMVRARANTSQRLRS